MEPCLERACEEIDAGLFSGDAFENVSALSEFKEYVERWERRIKELEETINEIEEE